VAQILAVICTLLMLSASFFTSFDCWVCLPKVCQIAEEAVECERENPRPRKASACGSTVIVVEAECAPLACSGKKQPVCEQESDCSEPKTIPCCILVDRHFEGVRWEPDRPVSKLPEIPQIAFNLDSSPSVDRVEGIYPRNIHPTIATTVLLM